MRTVTSVSGSTATTRSRLPLLKSYCSFIVLLVIASPRVYDHKQAHLPAHAKRHKQPLVRIGFIIRDRDGVRVVKNRHCFGAFEHFIARTGCAYINTVGGESQRTVFEPLSIERQSVDIGVA